jgi:hypothetical protein
VQPAASLARYEIAGTWTAKRELGLIDIGGSSLVVFVESGPRRIPLTQWLLSHR